MPHIYWRRLCDKVEKILEDSAIRNVHKHAQAQAVNSSKCLSIARQGDRHVIDHKPTEIEDDSVCQQLHVAVDLWALLIKDQSTEDRSLLQQRPGILSLSTGGLWLANNYVYFQNLSDSDFKRVSESFFVRAIDWMARTILLKIWKV